MIVSLTAEGMRRLNVTPVISGSPLNTLFVADIEPSTVDAAIILGYIVQPPGWRRQFG